MRKIIIALLLLTTGHSAFASFSFPEKKKHIHKESPYYTREHSMASTYDEKFKVINDAAMSIGYVDSYGKNLTPFEYIRSEALSLSIETPEFKKSLVDSCFYAEPNRRNEANCTYNMYVEEVNSRHMKQQQDLIVVKNKEIEVEERQRIHDATYGADRTDANLEKYCKASAIIDTVAYTRAAGVSSIYDYQYEDAKKLVSLTPAQERAWKVHASENPDYALLVASDFRMQQNEFNSYRIKCFAEPHMILNFLNIFHIKPENYDEAVANWKHGNN